MTFKQQTIPFAVEVIVLLVAGAIFLLWQIDTLAFDQAASTPQNRTGSYVKRGSSAIAMTGDGQTLLAVNPDSDTVTVIDITDEFALVEVPVGDDPRTVTVTAAGDSAYVANRGSHSVSVVDLARQIEVAEIAVGARPYGVVLSPDEQYLFVAEQGADRVTIVETETLAIVDSIGVADRPSGLAVTADGRSLWVTHLFENALTAITIDPEQTYLPLVMPAERQLSHASSSLSLSAAYPMDSVPLWPDSNLVQAVVIAPDGRAYIPHTRSNSQNDALTVDTTVFPLVSVVDTAHHQHLIGGQFNLDILDPPAVGLPFDVAFTPDGAEMWVVNAASNDVTVIDLHTRQRRAHIEVGDNPRGITINPAGTTAFVNNTLAGTVSVIDTAVYTITTVITTTEIPLPPTLLQGKRLFFSSDDPRMSLDQWMSCNSCHFDGEHDGRTWLRRSSGPRNTPSLLGMSDTFPLRWSGEWDEAADAEFAIRVDSFGSGLIVGELHCSLSPPDCASHPPNSGRSSDLDALASYLHSLQVAEHPDHLYGGGLSAAAQRGKMIFERPLVGCAVCHTPPSYTDGLLHDVGTATAADRLGSAFNTPSLLGLYDSAPYFHDGRAQTLYETITHPSPGGEHDVTGILSEIEILDLLAFLAELSQR